MVAPGGINKNSRRSVLVARPIDADWLLPDSVGVAAVGDAAAAGGAHADGAAMTIKIPLPHNGWLPREHQMPLWRYLTGGGKRAIAIWHRRAGKDEIALHFAAVSAASRVGNHWHCLPEFEQGRKTVWNAVNSHTGKRRIDEAFPLSMRRSTNETEMLIKMINGSTFQIVGSDRYNAMVGAGPVGITFSEFALANPSAWGYFRPMLEENDGWALFITTPRGLNHAKAMFDYAQTAPGWFAERLTVHDTGMLLDSTLATAAAEYRSLYGADYGRAQFEQEYLCSFNAGVLGAFYAVEMGDVRREGRVIEIEPLPGVPVNTAWDIGVKDDTAVWMWQAVGAQLYVLDHYASSGVGVEHYRDLLAERFAVRGWIKGIDYVPHDAKVREFGSGKTRIETMQQLGLRPMLVPDATKLDGINALRRTLPLCVFHPRCNDGGLTALEQYRREWDDEKKAFKANEVHDWTSDTADAARYMALAWKPPPPREIKVPIPDGWHIPPPQEPRRGYLHL